MRYSASLFCQILQVIPSQTFRRLVQETGSERHSKGFSSWAQCVGMLFCQLAQAKSLREISDGLAATCGKLNHLGLGSAPAKSTLAYANEHRPWELWQRLFYELLDICRAESPGKKRKFRFKNKLYSLDATTIDLCLSLFPWANFRQTKGAVKLHLLLDHDGYLPVFATITDGKTHEVHTLRLLNLPMRSQMSAQAASWSATVASPTMRCSTSGRRRASSSSCASEAARTSGSSQSVPCRSAATSWPTS